MQAERTPPRVTITFALGELPRSWPAHDRRLTRTWTALVGLVLVVPFVVLVAASLLRRIGVDAPFEWIGSSSPAIVIASVSLFVGVPVALVSNLWRITRIGFRREHGELAGILALQFAPLHLIVVALSLVIAVAFVGHLAADSYACFNGVRSAC